MKKTVLMITLLTAIMGLYAVSPWQPAALGQSKGCVACHPKLSDKTAKSDAAAMHRTHYAKLGAAAQCSLCHQIDGKGNLRVIGGEPGKAIKATPEQLAKMQPYYKSWATSAFLDQKHGKKGVTCEKCHDGAMPEGGVKQEKCYTCHGSYEKLAEKSTFHNGTLYPHFSPEPVECAQCHKMHKKSELACTKCHPVSAKMP